MAAQLTLARKATPLMAVILLSACATADIYTADSFADYQTTHQEVAVLPFAVTIAQKNTSEGNDLAAITSAEKEEGVIFQKQLYSQFLKRWSKGEYTVKFQDVDETNVLLRRANMADGQIENFTKAEIGKALGVDAVISGTIKRDKPMGNGAAVASALLLGFGGATNSVNVNMTVHDTKAGGLLWSYDHEVKGGVGSSPESVSKSLMKGSSKKFPYKKVG